MKTIALRIDDDLHRIYTSSDRRLRRIAREVAVEAIRNVLEKINIKTINMNINTVNMNMQMNINVNNIVQMTQTCIDISKRLEKLEKRIACAKHNLAMKNIRAAEMCLQGGE